MIIWFLPFILLMWWYHIVWFVDIETFLHPWSNFYLIIVCAGSYHLGGGYRKYLWLEPELHVRHSFSCVQQLSAITLLGVGSVTRRISKEKALRIRSEMVPFPPYIFTLPLLAMAHSHLRRAALEQEAKVGSCCVLEEFLLGAVLAHQSHSSRSLLIRCLLECRTNTSWLVLSWPSNLPLSGPHKLHTFSLAKLSFFSPGVVLCAVGAESWHCCSVQARACGGVVVGKPVWSSGQFPAASILFPGVNNWCVREPALFSYSLPLVPLFQT